MTDQSLTAIAPISPAEALQLSQSGVPIADLRGADARRQDGAVPGAIELSLDDVVRGEASVLTDENETLLLICDSGDLSQQAAGILRQRGYPEVYVVDGGFRAWAKAEQPIVLQSDSLVRPAQRDVSACYGVPSIVVAPTSGHTGAEIHGVDLRQPLEPDSVATIRAALLKWKVVFFREQFLTPEQLVRSAGYFGEVMKARSPMQVYSVDSHPEILVVGKAEYPGRGVDSPWHADLTFLPAPPMGALLQAIDVPPYGGDTTFTNLIAAYADLSEPLQRMIDGLWAVHKDRFRVDGMKTVHPVVRVHPETGERLIWVNPNYTDHIVGLTARESEHILSFLYEHMTRAAYTTRFRWFPGSIAFWDNRSSAHAAPTDLSYNEVERILYRVTITGEVPRGITGEASYPYAP